MPPMPAVADNFLQLLTRGFSGTLVTSLDRRGNDSNESVGRMEEKLVKRLQERPPNVDPFSNHIKLEAIDYVQLAVGSVLLLPIRAVGVVSLLLLSWLVARVGLLGLTSEQVESINKGRRGWRRKLMRFFSYFGYLIFIVAGFRVTIKGRQASRKEASILVGAPHSTFLEALIMIMCSCSPVAREEGRNAFIISACQLFYQTLFIDRRTPEGRQKAKDDICTRALSYDDTLPQLFICPEGTNTNRKALIRFKVGAFIPAVAVQPLLIRYPGNERLDAITWTYNQRHGYFFSLWYLLTKPLNRVDLEFLPVYSPSMEEHLKPEIFAKNVQVVMAKALGISSTDLTFTKYYNQYCSNDCSTAVKRQSHFKKKQ